MKHRFLLDIMVLFFAIKEENAAREHDETCTNLIQLIGQNCHLIVVDRTMRRNTTADLRSSSASPNIRHRRHFS